MKQTMVMRTGALLLALALVFGATVIPALAHGDEDHSGDTQEMSIAEMEQMIGIMQQLIMLLTTLRTMQSTMTTPVVHTPQEMEDHHNEHSEESEDEHEHASDNHEDDEAKLVIEVEPHNNQTHVHVRYVDKPEEMFFIEAGMSDEGGIVSAVSARTGLSQDEVREALAYMQ